MRKQKIQILLIAILLILFLVLILSLSRPNKEDIVIINSKKIVIEIADSPEEHSQGLMFRTSLPEDHGMLFIFEQPSLYAFWMKNTLIPLDMIFINENQQIADIQTAQPCTSDPCPLYKPSQPVLYVLEVNAGFSERNNIKVGDKVEIKLRNKE